MDEIFNTVFETSLRILLLLSVVAPEGMTIDRIVVYDFLVVYGQSFSLTEYNLNGENTYRFTELSARRTRCDNAIKSLALDGLIAIIKSPDGFKYKINFNGDKLAKTLTSGYASGYLQSAKQIQETYKDVSDSDLVKEINMKAIQLIRR